MPQCRKMQRPTVDPVGSPAHSGDAKHVPVSAPHLSIVVLPFANLGGDTEQDYFVDGVTENLTTDLSRISGSFVIGSTHRIHLQGQSGRSSDKLGAS